MVNNLLNFIIGTFTTASTASAINGIDPIQFGSIEDLVKYIVSIVGGILAAIIINILKKKFPEWFNSKAKSNSK